jgi:O-antigen ligase
VTISPATATVSAIRPTETDNSGAAGAFGFFWSLIALLPWYCFLFDSYLAPLHLPMISMLAGLMAALLSGSVLKTAMEMPGFGYIFLTIWMMVGVPFAVWRGGALNALLDVWIVAVITFFVIACNVNTIRKIRIAVAALACGLGITMFGAVVKGTLHYGRLGIPGTRFGDANDLALVCVMGLPLLGFACLNRVAWPVRLFAMGAVPALLYTFLRTGSRGGMVGLVAVSLILFFKTSVRNKMKLAGFAAAVILIAPFVTSREVIERFMLFRTTFDDGRRPEGMAEGATDSANARKELLIQSLRITGRHPIFGVGMNNFAVAENDLALAAGKLRGSWHVTHNMYTQWSSEAGIPAALMVIAMLISCWKMLTRVERARFSSLPADEQQYAANLAFAFKASLFGYCVSGMFLGVAYVGQLPVLFALISQFSKAYLRFSDPVFVADTRGAAFARPRRQAILVPGR